MLNEEQNNLDNDLKELFMDTKFDEMRDILDKKDDSTTKELSGYNWNIINRYFEAENYELLFQHYKFVAYSCFLVEYAHKRGLIGEDAFAVMMSVYNDIYELNKKRRVQ